MQLERPMTLIPNPSPEERREKFPLLAAEG